MYALSFSLTVSFSIWCFVCDFGGVASFGLAGIDGTLTLRSCDKLGVDTEGFAGFNEASADNDGLVGLVGLAASSSPTSVVKGSIQRNARIAVQATAAGIQNPVRVFVFATLALIRVARCGGALIAW
jgi:hypothetical protein